MSDSPLMSKMDALLKKHRGGVEDNGGATAGPAPAQPAAQAAPPGAWLPVLTDVIQRGSVPVAAAAVATLAARGPLPSEPEPPAPREAAPAIVTDTLAEQLMSELAPRLSEVMEKQVAAELRKNLDQTVASLLSQLDVNVREIVRDAVAEKLKQPRDPSS